MVFAVAVLAAPSGTQAEGAAHRVDGTSLTEIIYALGAEKLLVGVDLDQSLSERSARPATRSATCALSAEGVLALKPTLILAPPRQPVLSRRSTSCAALASRCWFPDRYDYDSVVAKIAAIGKITGKLARLRP